MDRIVVIEPSETALSKRLGELSADVESRPCVISALELAREHTPDLFILSEGSTILDIVDLLQMKQIIPSLHPVPTLVLCLDDSSLQTAFRHGADDAAILPVADTELLSRIRSLLRRSTSRAMLGSLEEVSFIDVIQMLASAQRTGVLVIESGARSGKLFLSGGQVVHAVTAEATGEEAFLEILRGTRRAGGGFSFRCDATPPPNQTIDRRTDHLLLSLASTLDEESDAEPAAHAAPPRR